MSTTDEEIVAEILAAAVLFGRPLEARMHFGIDPGDEGPMCAVGAGVLYRALDRGDLHRSNAIDLFAEYYNVTRTTAVGVSDGFEFPSRYRDGEWTRESLFDGHKYRGSGYERGWAIGAAVRSAIEGAS